MIQDILTVVFNGIMPYLAPIVLIIGSVKVTENLAEMIVSAFDIGAYRKRRDSY